MVFEEDAPLPEKFSAHLGYVSNHKVYNMKVIGEDFNDTEIIENLPHLFRFETIHMLQAHLIMYKDNLELCKKEVEDIMIRYGDLDDEFS